MLNDLAEATRCWTEKMERTTSWSPKTQCVYGPENQVAAVTFFVKNGAALPKSNTFASVTECQDSREHGC